MTAGVAEHLGDQLERLLRGAVRRLDFMERAQAVARSNGKVRIGPGDPPIPKPDDVP